MQPDMQTLLTGARSLVKTSVAQQPVAADMGLDMDGIGGLASDYLLGGTVGLNRAGRAKQLGRAMHRDIPGPLNHPSTSMFLQTVGGGLGGGAIGGLAGYGLGSLDSKRSAGDGAVLGSALGAGVGGIGGMLRSLYKRRQAMRDVATAYEKGTPLDPAVKPHTGLINTLLTPFGGPVRSGEADVYEATHGKYHGHQDRVTPDIARTGLNAGLEVGSRVAPMAKTPVMGLTGLIQNLNARKRVRKVDAENEKTAADTGVLQQLLDGGRSLVNKVDLKNPAHTGAIGAGVGALGGLASGAMSDEEEPGYLRRALVGGLAGGGLGAGAGALNAKYNPAAQPGPPKTPKLVPPAIGSPEQLANNKKLEDVIHAWGLNPPNTGPSGFKPGYLPGTRPAGIVNGYYPGQKSIEAQMHPTDDGSGYNQPWSKDPHYVKQYTDPSNPRRPAIPEILKSLGLPPKLFPPAPAPTATPAATPQPNPFVRPPEQDVAEFISKLNTPPDEYIDMARGDWAKRRYPPAFAHARLLELRPDDSKLKHIIHSARQLAAARASQPHPGEIPQELWESIYGKYPYPEKPRGPGWQATEAFPTF